MDEGVGGRLTRLRRRLSVEQNEELSQAPVTPTKKRATKAKPQLDDIVENAVVSSPKRATRRSIAVESGEAAEERAGTPGARAARVRSNTSLLADTALAVGSPRAKRASRRNSLAGSDTESTTVSTPARRSRRISKEFNKSPETSGEVKLPAKINKKRTPGAIAEESDNAILDTTYDEDVPKKYAKRSPTPKENNHASKQNPGSEESSILVETSPANIRKSIPRENHHASKQNPVSEESSILGENSPANIRKSPRFKINKSSPSNSQAALECKPHNKSPKPLVENLSSQESQKKGKSQSHKINKTPPTTNNKNESSDNKRFRTKSLTSFNLKSFDNSISYFSDNEIRKGKSSKKKKSQGWQECLAEQKSREMVDQMQIAEASATPLKVHENKENVIDTSGQHKSFSLEKSFGSTGKLLTNISGVDDLDITTQIKDKDEIDSKGKRKSSTSMQSDKVCEPNGTVKIYSKIFMDDSDTNEPSSEFKEYDNGSVKNASLKKSVSDKKSSISKKSNNTSTNLETDVSFGNKSSRDISITNSEAKNVFKGTNVVFDNTCEPMDIDETIPGNDNVIDSDLNILTNENTSRDSHTNRKLNSSSLKTKETNKEKKNAENSIELEKTNNASKSTIILSLNDIDISSACNPDKSHRKSSNGESANSKSLDIKKNTPRSKSFDLNTNKEPGDKKKNLSAVEGTPLALKTLQNIGVFTSTPVQTLIKEPTKKNQFVQGPEETSVRSASTTKMLEKVSSSASNHTDDSDEEIGSGLMDNEAQDAGVNYESGDSQDEEEREYTKNNEIPVGGETLDSTDNSESDDSEYEKDSFVVSSAEEDQDLLSGSGDDLSLTDNELKMTTKSKVKYNERKAKEQKHASREMFEARHGKTKSDEVSDESEDSEVIISNKNRKKNRLRLDSSKDSHSKLSLKEAEISIFANSSLSDRDPLSMTIKQEVNDLSVGNNTLLEPIENVEVDPDVTVFANKDIMNPLNSFNGKEENSSSDSDDGGIAENYHSLLQNLNSSGNKSSQNTVNEVNTSLNSVKNNRKERKHESILEILNISQEQNNDTVKSKKGNVEIHSMDLKLQIHADDSVLNIKHKGLKKNLSFSEYKELKNKNENSLLDKLNLTGSRNQKQLQKGRKSVNSCSTESVQHDNDHERLEKYGSNMEDVTDSKCKAGKGSNTKIDDSSSVNTNKSKKSNTIQSTLNEDSSSDSINFKLLFEPDEDSNNAPVLTDSAVCPDKHEDNSYPLKKSEGKTNLLETSSPSINTDELKRQTKTNKKSSQGAVAEENENAVNDTGNQKSPLKQAKSRKRKERDHDIVTTSNNKVLKINTESKIGVHRLPASILAKLDEVPQKLSEEKTIKVTATSEFRVDPVRRTKNKPSLYLEDSIHIDAMTAGPSHVPNKQKLLKSIPTASTSSAGFTTNFKIKVLRKEKRQDANLAGPFGDFVNFKTERLYGSSIKRIAADDLCRKQKRLKFTRF